MEINQTLNILLIDNFLPTTYDELIAYLSADFNINTRTAVTLSDFLINHVKKFDKTHYHFSNLRARSADYLNRSIVDIVCAGACVQELPEKFLPIVDFTYPFEVEHFTFAIRKPEYEPHIFGIFQTFSPLVWMSILLVLIMMMFIYFIHFKCKYSFENIFFHVLAILLRQDSILKPSTTAENLLVYSWVFGAMFLCLAYDSVFLSFLAVPPVVEINNISQLARAVSKGEYHCFSHPGLHVIEEMVKSPLEDLKIIGANIEKNKISFDDFDRYFFTGIPKHAALITESRYILSFKDDTMFVSNDRFIGCLLAMPLRKDFCCKNLIETFVHRLMSSGLYKKFENDFVHKVRTWFPPSEEIDPKRTLTLTDVAPAFIFLMTGHLISFFVLIGEVRYSRWKRKNDLRFFRKRKNHMQYV